MNPYEEPASKPEAALDAQTNIQWLVILQATGIFTAMGVLINFSAVNFNAWEQTTTNMMLAAAINASPWAAGALYLALRIHKRWILNGLIYSFSTIFTALIIIIAFSTGTSTITDLLWFFALPVLIPSFLITSLTMAITKSLIRLARTQR